MKIPASCRRSAVISYCGTYRYELWRCWDHFVRPTLYLGALNPSTADATVDDHTVRKVFGFCVRLGFGSFCIWNLFAGRATDPKDLWRLEYPVGRKNDAHIMGILDTVSQDPRGKLVVAWGGNAPRDREAKVLGMIDAYGVTPFCWGRTAAGQPRHPLMLAYETPLEPFDLQGAAA